MKRYENFVGLTEVKAAQGKVVQMEKAFVETQELRRELQMKVHTLIDVDQCLFAFTLNSWLSPLDLKL